METKVKRIKQKHVFLALVTTILFGLTKAVYAPPATLQGFDIALLVFVTLLFITWCFLPPQRKEDER